MISPLSVYYTCCVKTAQPTKGMLQERKIYIHIVYKHMYIYILYIYNINSGRKRLHNERTTQFYGHLLSLPGKTKAI